MLSAFNNKFKNVKFQWSENAIQNIKIDTIGSIHNLNIEDLCKSLALNDENIIISIFPIKSEYIQSNTSEITIREQNIIIIGLKDILKYFDSNKVKMLKD